MEGADVVTDDERLYHFFFRPDDYAPDPILGVRVRQNKFRTGHCLSFNRHKIWSLEKNQQVARPEWGICSLTAGELRGVYQPGTTERPAINIAADPWHDPLLNIFNPSHASVNRTLTKGEAGRVADIASQMIHQRPTTQQG